MATSKHYKCVGTTNKGQTVRGTVIVTRSGKPRDSRLIKLLQRQFPTKDFGKIISITSTCTSESKPEKFLGDGPVSYWFF